jgi:hypothetical protein
MTLRHSYVLTYSNICCEYFESTSNFFYFNPTRETYHVLTSGGEVASILPLKNIMEK